MEAIIFAAGFGKRLGALTRDKPKALLEVAGRTLLEHNILYLRSYGVRRLVINVHYRAEQIIAYLRRHRGFGLPYRVVWERGNAPLETGGGLENARLLFTEKQDFITLNADILTDVDLSVMYAYHQREQNLITLLVGERSSSRGLYFNQKQELAGWANCKSGEYRGIQGGEKLQFLPFWGITMCNFAIFEKIRQLANSRQNLGKRYSLLDLWLALLSQGQSKIKGYVVDRQRFCDVGTPERLAVAQSLFA